MAEVEPDDVTALLDQSTPAVEQAVPLVTTMAKAYTRGRGFTGNVPNREIAAVVTIAAARFAANSRQTSSSMTSGPFAADLRSFFTGWTVAEQIVLNRYRVRAQ
jgi:hypothetical protein